MARSGEGRLSRRILEDEQNRKDRLGAWALASRLMEHGAAEGKQTVDCYLTERERHSEVETKKKEETKQRGTNHKPKG